MYAQKSISFGLAALLVLWSSAACRQPAFARSSHALRSSLKSHSHRSYHALASRSIEWHRGEDARVPPIAMPKVTREVRAMWVVGDSISTPAKINAVITTARQFGFNTLFVQVRGRGDAWYHSTLEPRAEDLANQPASFDPLQQIISQAHTAGIQVHAWVNACYVWSAGRKPYDSSHIVNAHPDWLARDSSGNFRMTYSDGCEGAFLSPSNPAARQHLHDVFLEIVNNYDVDGIHFDYIRYPNHSYDYSQAAISRFADSIRSTIPAERRAVLDAAGDRAYVHAYAAQWADWRRDQVTSLVEWISKDVKTAKPWVCVSAAVFADYNDAYNERGQDWKKWLTDGALDAVVPMAYSGSTVTVAEQINDAESAARADGKVCYAGIGSWHISPASTLAKIQIARELGAQGVVLFSYGGVTDYGTNRSYVAKVAALAFNLPVALPKLSSVAIRPVAGTSSTPDHPDSSTQAPPTLLNPGA